MKGEGINLFKEELSFIEQMSIYISYQNQGNNENVGDNENHSLYFRS